MTQTDGEERGGTWLQDESFEVAVLYEETTVTTVNRLDM